MFSHSFLFALIVSLVQADFGPYIQSFDYENGEFTPWPHETYRSSPVLGPSLNYLEYFPLCNDGLYTLISPQGHSVPNPSPMIIDQDGHLIWASYPYYGPTYNLNVYQYRGQNYLTFWAGKDNVDGHGEGVYYMLDSSYEEVYTIQGANGLHADLNEFHITRDETAVFTVYDLIQTDLRPAEGPKDGWIWDSLFQEVDIESGNLLFQWRASDHLDLNEVFSVRGDCGYEQSHPWDAFHIDSVDKDGRGNFLISVRHTNSLIYIDGRTGDVIWKLGGKNNMFTDLSDGTATNINSQHHARFSDYDTAIILFDNAATMSPPRPSRGLYLNIDQAQMTAQVRHTYINPHNINSDSYGSIQLLPTGNVLVGYGSAAAWTEYTLDGQALCDVHFGPESEFNTGDTLSGRVFKQPWVGLPQTSPTISLSGYEAAVSWNGATEVVTWVLQGTDKQSTFDGDDSGSAQRFSFLIAVPKNGYETIIHIPVDTSPERSKFLRVLAIDASGTELGWTRLMEWDPNVQIAVTSPIEIPNGSTDFRPFGFFLIGFVSATVAGIAIWVGRNYALRKLSQLGEEDWEDARGRKWRHVDFDGDEDLDLSDDELEGVGFPLMGKPSGQYEGRRGSYHSQEESDEE